MSMKLQPKSFFVVLGLLDSVSVRKAKLDTSPELAVLGEHIEGVKLRANPGPWSKCPKCESLGD